MAHSDTIENQLETIINTGYEILDSLQQNEPEFQDVKQLFALRREQLDKLNEIRVDKKNLSNERHQRLRDLFTRLSLLEKSMNNVFAKLSLQYRKSIKELGLQQKAKKSYSKSAITSKFLDAQISG